MLIKLSLFFGLLLSFSTVTYANSDWVGTWEKGRTSNIGGTLNIKSCKQNVCIFDLQATRGGHLCVIENKQITISGNKAVFKGRRIERNFKIDFTLDKQKNEITVTSDYHAHWLFCSLGGDMSGVYENSQNPLYYKTGFDCNVSNLPDSDKVICSNQDLANANYELTTIYPNYQTPEKINERRVCQTDEICLMNYYQTSIKEAFTQATAKPFKFYEYTKYTIDKTNDYNLTHYFLINKVLKTVMNAVDYDEFTTNLIAYIIEPSLDGIYAAYGVPGLFTIMEATYHIDTNGDFRIAFLSPDGQGKEYLIVYLPDIYDDSYLPKQFAKWIEEHKEDKEILYIQLQANPNDIL